MSRRGGREVLAEILSEELGQDLSPQLLRGADVILLKLYLNGYALRETDQIDDPPPCVGDDADT